LTELSAFGGKAIIGNALYLPASRFDSDDMPLILLILDHRRYGDTILASGEALMICKWKTNYAWCDTMIEEGDELFFVQNRH
jgi:hypothetical protein